NHARMALGCYLDRSPDRRRGVRGEPETQAVVELVNRPCECEVSFLDEVEQRNVVMCVLTGDPDDEPEVSLDQKPFRTLVSGVPATEERALLGLRENRRSSESAGVEGERVLELEARVIVACCAANPTEPSIYRVAAHMKASFRA